MDKCNIRFAEYEDIPAIMQYINDYWRNNHILARDRELFKWQYVSDNKVNFVLGVDKADQIQGIIGYIPYDDSDEKDIALALWKANSIKESPFLGVELLVFLMKNLKYSRIVCTGINIDTTKKIYEFLGIKTGLMKQWYRLSRMTKYSIGEIRNYDIPDKRDNIIRNDICLCESFEEAESRFDFDKYRESNNQPYKSRTYVKKRYYHHPSYDYKVYSILNQDNKNVALLVLRIQEYECARIIRLIDLIGDVKHLEGLTEALDRLLIEFGAEYIDLYETGIPDDILYEGGWLPVKDSGNIIPNYFAPYVRENIDIYYSSSDKDIILFRGDGDQDRPN